MIARILLVLVSCLVLLPEDVSADGAQSPSAVSAGAGATGALWTGATLPTVQFESVLPIPVSAVFEWSNPSQKFDFWFRGFPGTFNTLIGGLIPGRYYFFQSATPVEILGPVGTLNNPLPIGTGAAFEGAWSVKVLSITPDATAIVLAQNPFNDPPAPGRQFFMARFEATYSGGPPARFDGSYRLRAVGSAAVLYTTFGNSCGVIPDKLPDPEVFTGGTISGVTSREVV